MVNLYKEEWGDLEESACVIQKIARSNFDGLSNPEDQEQLSKAYHEIHRTLDGDKRLYQVLVGLLGSHGAVTQALDLWRDRSVDGVVVGDEILKIIERQMEYKE